MEQKQQMPDFVRKIWSSIPVTNRFCFCVSMITGLLVHFYMLSNKITNLDDIVCVPGVGGGKVLGRWFQEPVHDLFSPWSSPALNGIMALIILSIAACVIVNTLKLKSVTGAVLVGITMMTLPSTASNMYYMYLAPTFALSILASTINVQITSKYKFGWILGAVLQFFSMACYQAYFGLSASLFVLVYMLMLIDGGNILIIVKKGLRSIIGLGIAMAGYLVSLKFVDLSDYKGLSDIGQTSAGDILLAILRAYHRVLQYFITAPESFMKGAPTIFNRLLVVMAIGLFTALIIKKKIYVMPLRGILILILLIIFPFALGLVYVMAPQLSHASTVMIYSYSVFYFFIIALMERILSVSSKNKVLVLFASITFIALLLEFYASARVVNNAYYRSYIAQNRVMQYYNRILTKLEAAEGFKYGEPMTILGGFYPDPLPVSNHNMNGKELVDFEGATLEDLLFLPTNRDRVLQIWFGLETGDVTMEKKEEIMETSEFKQMPSYPADGCAAKIKDVWVVKINEDDSK
ncbi:glucosyltransferase domain-containing protein [Butyrivibrio sp. JL13D10]|uniref:glucosyltransferase domain-containing protein n=1 Tax=Butyrivibrio sp. JL13D10 TaxID=3236815 RepID=UPI0038B57AA1